MDELRELKEQYRKGTADVLRFAVRVRRILVAQLVLLALGALVFTGMLLVSNRLAHRNSEAIEVGCTLLRNAIIQTGAADDPHAGPSDRERLNGLLIESILTNATPARRAEARVLIARVAAKGMVTIPDCHQIALHPQSVKAVDAVQERKAAASRSGP